MKTVLFVDDEEMVVEVVKEMLKAMDYNVFVATSGQEAIDIYAKHKDKIALVLLDMIMPDMEGSEVYDRIKRINADVKVLLCSGYSRESEASKVMEQGCSGFVQKPFTMEQLSQSIRRILDKDE